MDELEGAVSRLKIDSAPGPDNILSKLLINADKTVLGKTQIKLLYSGYTNIYTFVVHTV
jgi:hypothetical protein